MFEEKKPLKESELYRIVGRKAKSNNPEIARRYIRALIETIYEELKETGKFKLYGLGAFWVTYVEPKYMNIPRPDGTTFPKYVDGYYKVKFKESRPFRSTLNDRKYNRIKFLEGQEDARRTAGASAEKTDEAILLETLEAENQNKVPTKKEYREKLEKVYEDKAELEAKIIEAKLFEEQQKDYKARTHYNGKRSMLKVFDREMEKRLLNDIVEEGEEELED